MKYLLDAFRKKLISYFSIKLFGTAGRHLLLPE